MLSRYSFLALSVALLKSFFTVLSFFLPFLFLPFYLLHSSILLIISSVIHGFLALLSSFPQQSLIVRNTHFLLLFHCTFTFPLSHLIASGFSSRVSCTFFHWACNFSRCHLGFWDFMIFCSLVWILAISKLWSESISAPDSVHTSFIFFLNWCFRRMLSNWGWFKLLYILFQPAILSENITVHLER